MPPIIRLMPCLVALALAAPAPAAAQDDAQMEEGREIFTEVAQPSCGVCHILADAGTSGAIGPDLDSLAPSQARVEDAVRNGVGVMPAFSDTLSDEQIAAVSQYVAEAAGE